MDKKTGAPPDDYAEMGQNWGFPTYNWERMKQDGFLWWQNRLGWMANYFQAYRIDHILGFFRIWEMPASATGGLLGKFNPSLPITRDELRQNDLEHLMDRLIEPYMPSHFIEQLFGHDWSVCCVCVYMHSFTLVASGCLHVWAARRACVRMRLYVCVDGWEGARSHARAHRHTHTFTRRFRVKERYLEEFGGCYKFKQGMASEVVITETVEREGSPISYKTKEEFLYALKILINNVVLLRDDKRPGDHFYPRIELWKTSSFQELPGDVQHKVTSVSWPCMWSQCSSLQWRRACVHF